MKHIAWYEIDTLCTRPHFFILCANRFVSFAIVFILGHAAAHY
jgi:hypothetical protein